MPKTDQNSNTHYVDVHISALHICLYFSVGNLYEYNITALRTCAISQDVSNDYLHSDGVITRDTFCIAVALWEEFTGHQLYFSKESLMRALIFLLFVDWTGC